MLGGVVSTVNVCRGHTIPAWYTQSIPDHARSYVHSCKFNVTLHVLSFTGETVCWSIMLDHWRKKYVHQRNGAVAARDEKFASVAVILGCPFVKRRDHTVGAVTNVVGVRRYCICKPFCINGGSLSNTILFRMGAFGEILETKKLSIIWTDSVAHHAPVQTSQEKTHVVWCKSGTGHPTCNPLR